MTQPFKDQGETCDASIDDLIRNSNKCVSPGDQDIAQYNAY